MNTSRLILGIILLLLVAGIPVFWSMIVGGVFFGAPFYPLIITLVLAILGIWFLISAFKSK